MLSDDRGRQLRAGMSEALGLAQKLQALTDENVYLGQHLADMVLNNRALQSMRSRKLASAGCFDRVAGRAARRQDLKTIPAGVPTLIPHDI